MKKFGFLVTAAMFLSMISFSQTIKENIERQSKDPKTAENAAKADVYIMDNKKKISDSTSVPSKADRSTKKSRKKKHGRKC